MQIILKENVDHLGEIGDVVNVKPGFARNYLLPRNLAVVANARQIKLVEHEKRVIAARVAKLKASAELEKAKLDAVELTIAKAAGENEKLFGSVTAMEIESLLSDKGFSIERRVLQLPDHIKALGDYDIGVKLHRDVIANIKLHVVAETTEEA